jgi:hypothetical protein
MEIKVSAKVKTRELAGVVQALRVCANAKFAHEALELDDVADSTISTLTHHFPRSKNGYFRRDRIKDKPNASEPHLIQSWQLRRLSNLRNQTGFQVFHARAVKNPRIAEIIASLESGSSAYKRSVGVRVRQAKQQRRQRSQKPAESLQNSKVSSLIVTQPGKTNPGPGGTKYFTADEVDIPAREGIGFVSKAVARAKELIRKNKSRYVNEVKKEIRKRKK